MRQAPDEMNGFRAELAALDEKYKNLSAQEKNAAYGLAAMLMANQPQIQNSRIKAIPSLPVDYTKEQIGRFLQQPYEHEAALRETAEVLKWTNYPFFKIAKTISDIPTYRYYFAPQYVDEETAKREDFRREARLLDKYFRTFRPDVLAKNATESAVISGKVFYTWRHSVDKSHGAVNMAFWQRLPQDWCTLIGKNNVSGWTVSFNMMYFLRPGCDYKQFGDLFDPFIADFEGMFIPPESDDKRHARASYVKRGDRQIRYYNENINRGGAGNPRTFRQDRRWCYWVSLPVEKVFAFEIDSETPNVASPLAGLFMTYAQQSDFEAAQLSLLIAPLLKIFTGEIPYFDDPGHSKQNEFKLSDSGNQFFMELFDLVMRRNNTGGTAFWGAPYKNIQSHNFNESANANDISETFNRYGMEKAGLAGLIPVDGDVKAGQVGASQMIEGRFATSTIYPQMERMMNAIIKSLNLNYDWEFKMFGDIFSESATRENAVKMLNLGDSSAFYTIAALDGVSWVQKLGMIRAMNGSGMMDALRVPQTAYTQNGDKETGRPAKSIDDIKNGDGGESTENTIDAVGEKE